MTDWVPAMANEPVQLHPLEEVDDDHLISPISSNGSPPSPLRNTYNVGGYDLVDSDHGDMAARGKDESLPQPQTMSRGSTDGPGISPTHKASNSSSLPRKPVAAETPQGKPPRGRFIWATVPRLSHLLDKFDPRKRTGRGAADPSNDNLAPRCASDSSSGLPSPEAAGRRASKSSADVDIEPANEDFDDEVFHQKFGTSP